MMMAYTQMTMRHSHGSQAFATHRMPKARNGASMNVDGHTLMKKAVFAAVKSQNGAYGISRVSLEKTSHFGKTVCQAASSGQTDAAPGKLISKVEIPSFIPRTDLMDQLLRWALIEVQENGVASVGCQCKVVPYSHKDALWGFTVSFLKDGVSGSDVRVAFDEEYAVKHEWVGVGADGFPTLEGNEEQVLGKHFEVRKIDETPVTEDIRSAIKEFCQLLVAAINKYYAFGSCFVDDAT